MKEFIYFVISLAVIIILLPFFLILTVLIFLNDFKSPFYIAQRVGKDGVLFKMIKFRSMRYDPNLANVVSTSDTDTRITFIGRYIRKYKLDELSQLYNVVVGNMSIVGPRPNVKVEVDLYTKAERVILTVKPGITDFASIIFSDLNQILSKSKDPNTDYNQLVRPWKSRLALFYINHSSFKIDIKIIVLTLIGIFSRKMALQGLTSIFERLGAPKDMVDICTVNKVLIPIPPPGSDYIVTAEERNSVI